MRKILFVGATSAIAQETAKLLATTGDRLFLVARNRERLEAVAKDLQIRCGNDVGSFPLDVNELDRHEQMLDAAREWLDGVDTVLIAHGSLPDQKACEASFEKMRSELQTNFISVASLLTHVANRFEAQGFGTIAVISSVAGDRGRGSNYVYGTAKAAVSTLLQGLRGRLHRSGVRVLTIKPGFVDTPMTADFEKGLLWAQPGKVAKGIVQAISKGREVVYVPWFWRWIMLILRMIPEGIFKKLTI